MTVNDSLPSSDDEDLITDKNSDLAEKNINCIDCTEDFIWTIGEQAFFRDKQLKNPPKRCKPCKQAKNERIAAINLAKISGVKQKIEVSVKCCKCEVTTTVPFYPSQGRPVYCRTCYADKNGSVDI